MSAAAEQQVIPFPGAPAPASADPPGKVFARRPAQAVSLLACLQAFHGAFRVLQAGLASLPKDPSTAQEAAKVTRQSLVAVLDAQEAQAWAAGGQPALLRYRKAAYAMCALADELLLADEGWAGREAWEATLLETLRFGSRAAGDRLFDAIEDEVVRRPAVDADLLSVYLATLALGFRGRHAGPSGDLVLQRHRAALASAIGRRDGDLVCQQAYVAPLDDRDPVQLPDLQRWVVVIAVLIVCYLVVADRVWRSATSDLRTAIETMEQR